MLDLQTGFRNDHCNRPQKQLEPFCAQEGLCPQSTRRNNSQLSRRNSTGINCGSAKYRIPEHQILLQWVTYGRHGRLPPPNHGGTYPVQIADPACLPVGHDGAHGHGTGGRDYSIWHPGPSQRRDDMGLA